MEEKRFLRFLDLLYIKRWRIAVIRQVDLVGRIDRLLAVGRLTYRAAIVYTSKQY
jgi:hypothetical protein